MRESSTGQADGQGPEDECNQDGMEMLVEAMNRCREVPRGTERYREVPRGTPEVPRSTKKYTELLKGTQRYP